MKRKLNAAGVIDALADPFILLGPAAYAPSGKGPKFVAKAGRDWITPVGAKTAFIEPWVGELIPEINSQAPLPLG